MKITEEYVRAGLAAQGIPIREDEILNVQNRLAIWMRALDQIEASIGDEMNAVDPIPPVFPQEDFD
jgi:hypothetical protein